MALRIHKTVACLFVVAEDVYMMYKGSGRIRLAGGTLCSLIVAEELSCTMSLHNSFVA